MTAQEGSTALADAGFAGAVEIDTDKEGLMIYHETREIRRDRLIANADPVRTTPAMKAAHDELRASIEAHGLLEPLVVAPSVADGEYRVVAGNRRLAAIDHLIAQGRLSLTDAYVPCTVLDELESTTEAALAENVCRVAMHPADQATAFGRLAAEGADAADIAVRFGVSKSTVERRLRLAGLAPTILEAFRTGEIAEDVARAYATTGDTDRQLAVWDKLAGDGWAGQHPHNVLRELQEDRVKSDSDLAQFVGISSYLAAGGRAEATLFEDYSVFLDVAILERLASERLAAEAAAVTGWKWVEWTIDRDEMWNMSQRCDRVHPQDDAMTADEQAAKDAADAYADGHDLYDLTDEQEAEWKRLDNAWMEARRTHFERRAFTPEQRAAAGVVLHIDHGGKLGKAEGLVQPGDKAPSERREASGEPEKPKEKGYPQAVREAIMELRTAVLRDGLRDAHGLAEDILHFNLLLSLMTGTFQEGGGFYPTLPLAVERREPSRFVVPGASVEVTTFLSEWDWSDVLPLDPQKTVGAMFEAFIALPLADMGAIVAEITTRLLHSRGDQGPDVYSVSAGILDADYAEKLLAVDPGIWSVETFWGKLRRDQIIAEAAPYLGDEWAKAAGGMKKTELAASACELMRAHRDWLPRGFYPERGE